MANHTREYFNFSKKERVGIIVLLFLIFIVWVLPALLPANRKNEEKEAAIFKQEVAAFKAAQLKESADISNSNESLSDPYSVVTSVNAESQLFYFDPNTLSKTGWQQLGITDRTIQTIQKYISKGGRFYKPEELGKIFGLKKQDYTRLLPYVKIEKPNKAPEENIVLPQAVKQRSENKTTLIDINLADTTSLIQLPGIGSKLATRIINFRDKLGGFYSVEQIAEVYGISDTLFQKIRTRFVCPNPNVHTLNINNATPDELKAHPYIKYQIANAVIQYRMQHGNFTTLDQLKDIHLISEETFRKILPYVTID